MFQVFDCTKLEHVSVDFLGFNKLIRLVFSELGECLDDTLQDCLLDLTEERCILKCLTGDAQREIVS